jgi:hypothetical protein
MFTEVTYSIMGDGERRDMYLDMEARARKGQRLLTVFPRQLGEGLWERIMVESVFAVFVNDPVALNTQ